MKRISVILFLLLLLLSCDDNNDASNKKINYSKDSSFVINKETFDYDENYPWNRDVTDAAIDAIRLSIENCKKPEKDRSPNFPSNLYSFPFNLTDSTEFVVVGYSTIDGNNEIYHISFMPGSEIQASGPSIVVEMNIKTKKAIQVYMQADA